MNNHTRTDPGAGPFPLGYGDPRNEALAREPGRVRDWTAWAGRYVRLTFASEPYFGGRTLRWGRVREVTATTLIIDGYHDCNGLGDPRHGRNEVPVRFADVEDIREATPPRSETQW